MIKDVFLTFKKPKRKRWGSPVPMKKYYIEGFIRGKVPKEKAQKEEKRPIPTARNT